MKNQGQMSTPNAKSKKSDNKNNISNHLNGIILFQRKFRLYKMIISNMNNTMDSLYNLIYGIMRRITSCFNKDIIPQHKYNTLLNKLDSIVSKYKSLVKPLHLGFLKELKINQINDVLKYIINQLKSLSQECGMYNLLDVIKINLSFPDTNIYKYNQSNKSLINFFNKVFIPTSYCIYNKDDNNYTTNKDLTIYNPNITDDISAYDIYNISNITRPICKPLKKKIYSIVEHINGTRAYIPINFKKGKKIYKVVFAIDGYFKEDPLNMARVGGTIESKSIDLHDKLKKVKINDNFKYGYIEQLSLRDFITYNNSEIVNLCIDEYTRIMKLKDKTISSLVKDFLTMNIENQRNILTLFLLMKDDVETQYLAYLMYDMISNESYLLKPQPLAEQVYNSLHWSVQKLFKIAIKRVGDYTKKILNFNENDIPYEKRICLLKAPDYVKSKAMDKFKEVNKSNDNASKAQQYLDGLLRIPFGNFKKESIIGFLGVFKTKVEQFINNVISKIGSINIVNDTYASQIQELCVTYNKNLSSKEIELFLYQYEEINKELINSFFSLDENYIFNILQNFKKKNKLPTIKNLVKSINLDLKVNNQDTKILDKGRKNDIVDSIYDNIIGLKDINLKKKYLYFLQNSKRKLDEFEDIDDKIIYENYSTINENLKNLLKEWSGYKLNYKQYLTDVNQILDDAVYGQVEAKNEIKRIIAQWINGEMKGYCFGFEGPPGTGKTSLAKKGISKCLLDDDGNSRPFAFIAIGGSSNGSTLEGHSYTYVGSTWGKIVDVLIETQCMNPIIFIDELDKISKTENGKEIIGILTHLTDATQNDEFADKYFAGIKFDLSKVLFIFSYNDYSLLDPILADRIHRVKFRHLSKNDKIHIINNYIMPELLDTIGFSKDGIVFEKGVIEYIILNYTFEAGIRKLKEKVFEIVREINLQYMMDSNVHTYPIKITINKVKEIFENKPKMQIKRIAHEPHVGLVNGLYATTAGVGGLTIIETFKTISDAKLSLVLTGQQGDVMQESVQCAKTIAWNILPNDIKTKINKDWKDNGAWGIHLHCPEAATPKDGPSAGGAITLAIISLLTGVPVKNTVAMTGEIDLNGSIHCIGGLEFKIEGGKLAGAELILCPESNQQDLDIIAKEKPEILENIKVKTVKSIWEILAYGLVDNDLKFNKST